MGEDAEAAHCANVFRLFYLRVAQGGGISYCDAAKMMPMNKVTYKGREACSQKFLRTNTNKLFKNAKNSGLHCLGKRGEHGHVARKTVRKRHVVHFFNRFLP